MTSSTPSTPLTPSTPSTSDVASGLLAALERTGPRPALAWYEEEGRVELSGHVLANWVIKSIGHLHDEIALAPGTEVVLDLPAHWKRLVLALAVWSLGGTPRAADGVRATAFLPHAPSSVPEVLISDRPGSGPVEDADEVLAVDPISLAARFSGELPPLVHDWAQEVRASSDRLAVALPAWSGPSAEPVGGSDLAGGTPGPPARLLVEDDGLDAVPQVLGALLAGGGIVGPASRVDERRAADEQVTGRACSSQR